MADPYQMRRQFQKFYLGEGVTYQTLNDSFIMNYWIANKELSKLTGLHVNTIKQKCAREETTIQSVLDGLYR